MRTLALFACVVALASCDLERPPKPGGLCKTNKTAVCLNGGAILWCDGGHWLEVPCRGARGCMAGGGKVACDNSGNIAGDRCPSWDESTAYCAANDPKTMYKCENGRQTKHECSDTCASSGGRITCSQTVMHTLFGK